MCHAPDYADNVLTHRGALVDLMLRGTPMGARSGFPLSERCIAWMAGESTSKASSGWPDAALCESRNWDCRAAVPAELPPEITLFTLKNS